MRLLVLALLLTAAACGRAADGIAVRVQVDARAAGAELTPIWRFFGADEPNYATMKDGRRLLGELGLLRKGEVFFRAHNLLTSGDGTPAFKWGSTNAYTEDAGGAPRYDWHIVDGIFDTYLASGVRPYVELGFMPQALSSAPASLPYPHAWRPTVSGSSLEGGWSYPPRDYQRWSDLCYELTKHFVARYGESEVLGWWFETRMKPISPSTGRGRPKSSTSCTTSPSPVYGVRCPAHASADRTPRETVAHSWTDFSST
jgi:xylan 1,4-beta-xylosidase